MHKPRGLFHEYPFMKNTIEECIVDIKLFERPMKMHSKRKDNSDSCWLDHGTGSFTKVKPGNMSIPFRYKSCFKTIYATILFEFGAVYPFATNDISILRSKALGSKFYFGGELQSQLPLHPSNFEI